MVAQQCSLVGRHPDYLKLISCNKICFTKDLRTITELKMNGIN